MYQDELRKKLNIALDEGIKANAIAKKVNIDYRWLSSFRNRKICLVDEDAKSLSDYLDKLRLPV